MKTGPSPIRRLDVELRRLHDMGLGLLLHRASWLPGGREDIEAEVVGDEIRVYVRGSAATVRALRHEVVHFEVAQCTLPYVQALNQLLSGVNQEGYRRTERLAERLARLLDD